MVRGTVSIEMTLALTTWQCTMAVHCDSNITNDLIVNAKSCVHILYSNQELHFRSWADVSGDPRLNILISAVSALSCIEFQLSPCRKYEANVSFSGHFKIWRFLTKTVFRTQQIDSSGELPRIQTHKCTVLMGAVREMTGSSPSTSIDQFFPRFYD